MTATACERSGARVGIVTVAGDLHAHVVRQNLLDRHGVPCHIFETDRLAGSGVMDWTTTEPECAVLPDHTGTAVEVASLGAIWWRRPSGNSWNRNAPVLPQLADEAAIDLVRNDCLATFLGIVATAFRGVWVSDPDAHRHAENKLRQLHAARQAGLRIPQTLVSQNPALIRAFCARQPTIVKAVAGTNKTPLMAHTVNEELLASDDSLRLSPAIYQERIEGQHHLRVHAFGAEMHAALMTCDELDWRIHLDRLKVRRHALPSDLQRRLRHFLSLMGLNMGIFDLKLDQDGDPVWLEVNPQGQFLFLEGMSDLRLADAFADYLIGLVRPRLRVANSGR